MRKSRAVPIATLTAIALAFAACGDDEETAYCVDENDEVVENRYCDDERTPGTYFYSYGGRAPGGYVRGSTLNGGDRVDAADKAANAQRGGFGATAKSGGIGASFSTGGGS